MAPHGSLRLSESAAARLPGGKKDTEDTWRIVKRNISPCIGVHTHLTSEQQKLISQSRVSISCPASWTAETATAFNMESPDGAVGISTAAVVAIVCNVLVAVLILVLFLILYKACKVPSSQERVPVLAPGNTQQKNEQKYLLTT
ncbi:hypothetical protein SRHO_G00226840 [Serrasalmus rhombeus]